MIICKTHGENWRMEKLLFRVLNKVKTAMHLPCISHAIQSFAEANGFSIVRGYVGRGIRQNFQGDPYISLFCFSIQRSNILGLAWY